LALLGAALLVGLLAGALAYPFSLVGISMFYVAKRRTRKFLNLQDALAHPPFLIPLAAPALAPLKPADIGARYCGRNHVFTTVPSVRLLIDGGQTYPEMLTAIGSAQHSLILETYILRE